MTKDYSIQNASSAEETLALMKTKLAGIVPDFELEIKAKLAFKINQLKKEKNAVILAHNYMEPALYHSVSDYMGDSFELARISADSQADIIIFCGVRFMAETAKILNPIPDRALTSRKSRVFPGGPVSPARMSGILKKQFPGVPVVSYVNTYADVKAETDICCTSSNAAESRPSTSTTRGSMTGLSFYPMNTWPKTSPPKPVSRFYSPRSRPRKKPMIRIISSGVLLGWNGRCEVHEQFTVEDIENVSASSFPDVVILSHPECSPEVVAASDFSGSTKKMIEYVRDVNAPRYLLLTECSMGDNIAAENPHREMLRLCSIRCPHMNLITLEDTLASLEKNQYVDYGR